MRKFNYTCPDNMKPFIEQVLHGEYSVMHGNEFVCKVRLAPRHVLDIGANIGAFSFWASQEFPNVTIDAYEPNAKNVELYKENMIASAIPPYVYNIHQVAVSSTNAPSLTLYEGKYNCGMHSTSRFLAGQDVETFDAPTLHPAKLPQTDFLKVDTEGCEIDILSNYLDTHEKPTYISYEYHTIDDRITLDKLVNPNYVLCSGTIFAINLGVCNWMHKRHIQGAK